MQRLGNWCAYALAGGPSDLPGEDSAGRNVAPPIDQPAVKRALAPVRAALLLLLAIGGWKAARRGDAFDIAALFGLASTLTLLVSPLSWAHHYTLWLPGLLIVPAWQWRAGALRLAGALAISACGLMIGHYLLLDWAGRAGILGLGTTAWFIVAARIAARGDGLAAATLLSPLDSADREARLSRHAA